MGFIRKALYIATFGLSGLVFKETPSPQRTEKPAVKQMRAQTQAKATRAKSQAARKRKTQATRGRGGFDCRRRASCAADRGADRGGDRRGP